MWVAGERTLGLGLRFEFSFVVSIRPFEKGVGRTKAEFEITGQKQVGSVFKSLGLGLRVAGEEGGAATVDRPPPCSLAGLAVRRWREEESCRAFELKREK